MICFSALSAGTFGFSSLWACVSRYICQPDRLSHWLQLFLCCMPFARQLRFTSSHLCLNLLNRGGPTSIQLRAHASRRIELPLLESVWLTFRVRSREPWRCSRSHLIDLLNKLRLGLGHSLWHLLCLTPRNLLLTSAFGDWSLRKLLVMGSRVDVLESHGQARCIFPNACPPLITVTDSVSSVSSWAKASRMSKALDHISLFVGYFLNFWRWASSWSSWLSQTTQLGSVFTHFNRLRVWCGHDRMTESCSVCANRADSAVKPFLCSTSEM